MSKRVIRISELASWPAKPAKAAAPATINKRASKARPAVPARQGRLPVSAATIWRWVAHGAFPQPFKLGKCTTVWDAAEVEAFIEQQRSAKGTR